MNGAKVTQEYWGSESGERPTFAPGPAVTLFCDRKLVEFPLRPSVSPPVQTLSLVLGRDQRCIKSKGVKYLVMGP